MDDKVNWDEVEKIVQGEIGTLKRESSIIWDGKQFTVRIPKKFADVMALDQERDRMLFELQPIEIDEDGEATSFQLTGTIIKHG